MICHQRVIREQYAAVEPMPPVNVSLDPGAVWVRPISYQQAKAVVVKYEWLGRMSATRYHYGLFHDALFDSHPAAVACIGGANCTGSSHLHVPFGLSVGQVGVFARGVSVWWAHPHSASYLISRALKQLRVESPYKIVLAYSDPSAGEIGTVYQATNWTYIGPSTNTSYRYVSPDGTSSFSDAKIIVEAQRRGVRWKDVSDDYITRGWTRVSQARKHRYVYLLDSSDQALGARIQAMSKPYPKREQKSYLSFI